MTQMWDRLNTVLLIINYCFTSSLCMSIYVSHIQIVVLRDVCVRVHM